VNVFRPVSQFAKYSSLSYISEYRAAIVRNLEPVLRNRPLLFSSVTESSTQLQSFVATERRSTNFLLAILLYCNAWRSTNFSHNFSSTVYPLLLFIYAVSEHFTQKDVLTLLNLIFIWIAFKYSDPATSKTFCVFIIKISWYLRKKYFSVSAIKGTHSEKMWYFNHNCLWYDIVNTSSFMF
jgi:hypothetical protein